MATKASIAALRTSLRTEYPEIDLHYSDKYLSMVLNVPNRTYVYARDEKIRGALQWRREYNVDAICDAFRYVAAAGSENGIDGTFRPSATAVTPDEDSNADGSTIPKKTIFTPSQSLIDVCQSRAFVFGGYDHDGRAILLARTALLDWWKVGVDDGIRYHVLVIEHVLKLIRERNSEKGRCDSSTSNHGNNEDENTNEKSEGLEKKAESTILTPESFVIYVDTNNLSYMPPPFGALTGMTELLQRAYPDRVHRIYIGPVNGVLVKLQSIVTPYLRPRSRDKICLLEVVPDRDFVAKMNENEGEGKGIE